MKLKYYLRGIGIGIVITTIIFMISISLHKNEIGSSNLPEDKEDSKTVAALEKETESEETETSVKQNPDTESKPDTNTEKNTENHKNTDDNKNTDAKKDTETKDASKPNAKEKEKVRLEIRGGEFSDVICKKLKELGVIDDAEAFNAYLVEKNYDNYILPGVYDIPKDTTFEEIAALLTTKVKSP